MPITKRPPRKPRPRKKQKAINFRAIANKVNKIKAVGKVLIMQKFVSIQVEDIQFEMCSGFRKLKLSILYKL